MVELKINKFENNYIKEILKQKEKIDYRASKETDHGWIKKKQIWKIITLKRE